MPELVIMDAQAALGFVESQTSHIERQVNEVKYPDIQYPFLIPVDTSAHPFAQSVTYYSMDWIGKAGWINGNSDDVPRATTDRTQHNTPVYTAGIGYGYGWEEINQARMLGVPLASDDATAARRAYEEMVDRVALNGDAEKNFSGLIDYPGVTASAVSNGNWHQAATTPDQMLQDVNDLLTGVGTDTKWIGRAMANTILIPHERLNVLATRRLGDTALTVLQFLRANNVYTAMTGQALTIRAVRGLMTAGSGDVPRMVAYRRDPQTLKMHIPMPHRFLPAWQSGPLRIDVPGVFRLGGLDIRYPKEVRYGDGI